MSIVVDHCRLRGTTEAVKQARRHLQHNWWPSLNDAEIVIIRRVSTRSSVAELPRKLYRSTDQLIGRRVSAWSTIAAEADCVFFRSEAELIAKLSLDLATRSRADALVLAVI